MILCNIEFYSTPDGEVMVKECNQAVRKLEESDRDLILSFLSLSGIGIQLLLKG